MATTYPASKQSFTNPSGASTLDSPDHASGHTTAYDTIAAIEDTVGTTAGTNILKGFAAGNFPVRKDASNVVLDTLSGGTYNKYTMGSVAATGGTFITSIINNPTIGTMSASGGTFGTAQVIGGTVKSALIGTSQITGGTLTGVTFTAQTINNGTFGTPTIPLGSDATGDIFFRSAGGTVNRLAIGTSNDKWLRVNAGIPSWQNGVGSAICKVTSAVVQSIPNNTETTALFDTDLVDPMDMHSTVSNTGRIVVPYTGFYLISYKIPWNGNATGYRTVNLRLGTASTIEASSTTIAAPTDVMCNVLTTVLSLTANDILEVRVNQTSGGTLGVYSGGGGSSYNSQFMVLFLAPSA